MSQTIEFMVVWNRETQQALQVRTHHHHGCHQIAIFLPLRTLFGRGEEQLQLRYPQLVNKVGQQLSFAQGSSQQLEAAASLQAIFLQLRGGVIPDNVYTVVSG